MENGLEDCWQREMQLMKMKVFRKHISVCFKKLTHFF